MSHDSHWSMQDHMTDTLHGATIVAGLALNALDAEYRKAVAKAVAMGMRVELRIRVGLNSGVTVFLIDTDGTEMPVTYTTARPGPHSVAVVDLLNDAAALAEKHLHIHDPDYSEAVTFAGMQLELRVRVGTVTSVTLHLVDSTGAAWLIDIPPSSLH